MNKNKLKEEFRALVDFATGSRVATGFGYMDDDGFVKPELPVELWITGRMTHIFALASMLGVEGAREQMDHGIVSLTQYFFDPEFGGWYSSIAPIPGYGDVGIAVDDRKEAYAQAFVILAAASALAAGNESAQKLLERALDEQLEHWYEPTTGRVSESWNRAFTEPEAYRGMNSNMHTVEALLAASDVTRDAELLERATGVLHFVSSLASKNEWRISEHFDEDWNSLADYNEDQPTDPFRPYGVTPGHGLEWGRLMLQARASRQRSGMPPDEWMLDGAVGLINRAIADGWNVDGAHGFVYTTDYDGTPIVHERMHWVLCEAIGAASVLERVLEDEGCDTADPPTTLRKYIDLWWNYAQEYLVVAPGRWNHELDRINQKSSVTWSGKPDVYHAAQMLLIPMLPVSPTFGAALRRGQLEV